LACATAQYVPVGYYGYPIPTASQFHAQDALGQASYGYAYPGQAATNYRDAFGNQVGSYAYINPDGKEVRVSYVADSLGFRVLSNDLPVSPVDEGKAPVFEGKAPVFDGKAPEPVQDTPEVVAAKAEFAKLFKEAETAAAAVPEVVEVVAPVAEEVKAVETPVADVPVVVEEVKPVETPVADVPVVVEEVKPVEAPAADVPVVVEEVKPVDVPAADVPVVVEEVKPVDVPAADVPVVIEEAKSALTAAEVEWKAPEPVQDTPEVVVAKEEFSKLYKEAAAAADAVDEEGNPTVVESSRKKRQIPFYTAAGYPYALPYAPAVYHAALPAVKYVAPVPLVAPAPLVAKTTFKTVTAEADPSAKTPAATTKFDLKEKSFDVVTPLAYHLPYAYHFASVAAPAAAAPVAVESSRKKRQVVAVATPNQQFIDDLKYSSVDLNQDGQPDKAVVPVVPAFHYVPAVFPTLKYVAPAPLIAPVPLVAKTTVKAVTAEADPSAKTPAATTKFDLKEKSFDVVTPLAYHLPYAYTYPLATVAAAPAAVESSRKKRQVSVVPTSQFFRDFAYNSVDLNKDGQPDKAVYAAPVAYPGFYPYAYPFVNGFLG
jgi:hypothetical protein